jgi:hypothetical protein
MLGPLAQLAPEVMHPTAHRTIGVLWKEFDGSAHSMIEVPLELPS